MNEKIIKLLVFLLTALIHVFFLLFFSFNTRNISFDEAEVVRVMKLTDLSEFIPAPVSYPEQEILIVEEIVETFMEAIAEIMIETDIPPVQSAVSEELPVTADGTAAPAEEAFLPMHQLSSPPQFDTNAVAAALVYPAIALRSGIEGRVILELFVDRTGMVQRIIIIREEPQGMGFGEAAIMAFTGRRGSPALINDEPVSSRYRYPINFIIR